MAANTRMFKPLHGAIVVVVALAVAGIYAAVNRTAGSGNETASVFRVKRGPLTINVVESGTVKPSDQVIIKNELEGRSTILWLIEEGSLVKAEDLLVELDASELIDSRVDQEIKVQNAESDLVESRENLAVVRNQAKSDTEQAELTLRFAKEDLVKYKEGEYPNELKEVQGKITLAEEELERAADNLEWSRKLFAEKYISETELRADELAAGKAKLDLELARSELDLLKTYTYKRKLDQLTSDVRQAEMALERTQRKASADVVQAEARLRAREAEYNQQKDKLSKIGEQISKAKITAPTDGIVVYATSAEFSWRGNDEPLDEGQEVRERQELIHLPTADTFVADISIHEASLEKIYTGLPVRITVDALPGKVFGGRITRVAPLPDARSMFMNPDLKVYDTEVMIDGGGDVLRTGMSCQAEIVVEQHDDVLFVPVQCVVRVGGQTVVYLPDGRGKPTLREVEIGLDNNVMVHIVSGLEEGEQVLLAPPLTESSRDIDNEELKKLDIPERPDPNGGGGTGRNSGQNRRSGTGRMGRTEGSGGQGSGGTGNPGSGVPSAGARPDESPSNPAAGATSPQPTGTEARRRRPDWENMTAEQKAAARARWRQMREQATRE